MDGNRSRGAWTVVVLVLAALTAGCVGAGGDVEHQEVTREESEAFGDATTLWMEQGLVVEDADLSHWHYSLGDATPEDHQANLTEARERINQIQAAIQERTFAHGLLEDLMQESAERAHQVLDGIVACGSDYECPEAEDARAAFYETFDDLTEGLLAEMVPENDPRPR